MMIIKYLFILRAQIIARTLKTRRIAKRNIILYKERKLIKESPLFKEKIKELETKSLMMMPQCEGRSIIIENQEVSDYSKKNPRSTYAFF